MANTVTVNTVLSPGTYWLDWQTGGSAVFPGTWASLSRKTMKAALFGVSRRHGASIRVRDLDALRHWRGCGGQTAGDESGGKGEMAHDNAAHKRVLRRS